MNIDYHAGCADLITWENIKKLCPQPCALVELALSNAGLDMDRWLEAVAYDDSSLLYEHAGKDLTDGQVDELMRLFDILNKAFKKATRTGGSCLSLVACFESEVLSRNDAPRGGFFHVEGIYARTPSGKRFRKMYRRVFYVTRG